MSTKATIPVLCFILACGLKYITEISNFEVLALSFSFFSFLNILFKFGNSIAVRELMGFIASLQLLLTSAFVLIFDPKEMSVTSDEYFSYALPAVMVYHIGLFIPVIRNKNHIELLKSTKDNLIGKEKISSILLIIGLIGSLTYQSLPLQIRAIVYLFAVCLYASVMYGHYLSGKEKNTTLFIAFCLLIYTTIREGAFGSLIFWTTLYVIVVSTGTNIGKNIIFKISTIFIGLAFIITIQSVKFEYRMNTWGDKITDRRADPELLLNLLSQRFEQPEYLLSRDHLLSVSGRLNQGGLVALALQYVPRMEPYANGEVLFHFFYPIIPRLFWANKPITGGEANIERFTPLIHSGTSSFNISPFGEAYVNFGATGGIIFMFFFGLLFNVCFCSILKIAEKVPTVLLWIPCLFSACLTVETDILSMWGGFVTTAIFILILWQLFKRLNLIL